MTHCEESTFISLYEENPLYIRNDEVIPETVGQYTGLKDKNGVKVFENDIVEWCKSYKNRDDGKYQVIWQPKKCGFGLKQIDLPYKIKGMQVGKHLEITNNTHDKEDI